MKTKSINHKGHKGISQRSQRTLIEGFSFVYFVPSLCSLGLKKLFNSLLLILNIIFLFFFSDIFLNKAK